MRELSSEVITEAVAELCIEANKILPCSLKEKLEAGMKSERDELPKKLCEDILRNLDAAKELDIPICQDTGMAVVFIELGQDVHVFGEDINTAVNKGVAKGSEKGYLRKSIVGDPLCRVNTGDNTPAVIHLSVVPGEQVGITVAPKGFGSENMSALRMFTPAAGVEEIKKYIVSVVKNAGSNPCPPVVLGVGIGGDFEYCAYLAKKALCRDVSVRNQNEFYKKLEEELLREINELGIGPQGFGGNTTALAVNIEYAPTHIAGLPVAVNMGCHVTRHAHRVI